MCCENERRDVELLDPEDRVVSRGTAHVHRDHISMEIESVSDYRDLDGNPLERPEGHRFVLKLVTGETPQVRPQEDHP